MWLTNKTSRLDSTAKKVKNIESKAIDTLAVLRGSEHD